MTRRVLIWSVCYGVVFGIGVKRLLDLGEIAGAEPGELRSAYTDDSVARVHREALRIANLCADTAEGSGPT